MHVCQEISNYMSDDRAWHSRRIKHTWRSLSSVFRQVSRDGRYNTENVLSSVQHEHGNNSHWCWEKWLLHTFTFVKLLVEVHDERHHFVQLAACPRLLQQVDVVVGESVNITARATRTLVTCCYVAHDTTLAIPWYMHSVQYTVYTLWNHVTLSRPSNLLFVLSLQLWLFACELFDEPPLIDKDINNISVKSSLWVALFVHSFIRSCQEGMPPPSPCVVVLAVSVSARCSHR